jgi:hypothetical protein
MLYPVAKWQSFRATGTGDLQVRGGRTDQNVRSLRDSEDPKLSEYDSPAKMMIVAFGTSMLLIYNTLRFAFKQHKKKAMHIVERSQVDATPVEHHFPSPNASHIGIASLFSSWATSLG